MCPTICYNGGGKKNCTRRGNLCKVTLTWGLGSINPYPPPPPPPLYFHFLSSPSLWCFSTDKTALDTVTAPAPVQNMHPYPFSTSGKRCGRQRNVRQREDKQIALAWLLDTLKFLKDEVRRMVCDTVTHSPTFTEQSWTGIRMLCN